jgi:hypothetical protein
LQQCWNFLLMKWVSLFLKMGSNPFVAKFFCIFFWCILSSLWRLPNFCFQEETFFFCKLYSFSGRILVVAYVSIVWVCCALMSNCVKLVNSDAGTATCTYSGTGVYVFLSLSHLISCC